MGNVINLSGKRILKQKICMLANDEKYNDTIQEGLKMLNDKDSEYITNNDKIVVCYKLAYSYKKNNCYNEAVSITNKGIKYFNISKDDSYMDYYCRLLWLKNNCLRELGMENKEEAINDFEKIKLFYESIGEKKGANMVGFNIGYWMKDGESMLFYFKRILKSNGICTNVESNRRNYKACEDALLEIEEININCYNIAKTLLDDNMSLCS